MKAYEAVPFVDKEILPTSQSIPTFDLLKRVREIGLAGYRIVMITQQPYQSVIKGDNTQPLTGLMTTILAEHEIEVAELGPKPPSDI